MKAFESRNRRRPGSRTPRNASWIQRCSIYGVLDVLDVPRTGLFHRSGARPEKQCAVGGFWKRNDGQLEVVLKELEGFWRRAVRKAHPDRGGTHEDGVAVNLVWTKCKRLFALRGVTLN